MLKRRCTVNTQEKFNLTKREQFAMAAIQGILSNPYWNEWGEYTPCAVADSAIEYADELLRKLDKTNDG